MLCGKGGDGGVEGGFGQFEDMSYARRVVLSMLIRSKAQVKRKVSMDKSRGEGVVRIG